MESFKKWYERTYGYVVENNRFVSKWKYDTFMKKRILESKKDRKKRITKHMLLHCKNVEAFKKIFGRQTSIYDGEFRYYVWRRKFKGRTFLVFSSNKGTSTELVKHVAGCDYHAEEDARIIIEFYKDLLEKLEKYYKEE